MTVKELNDLSYENYNVEIYEATAIDDESMWNPEYICSTKINSKGVKPYLNRNIIGFKLRPSLSDGNSLIKLYLEAEKC